MQNRRDPTHCGCNVNDVQGNGIMPWPLKDFAVLPSFTVMSIMVRSQSYSMLQDLQLPVRQQHVLALTQRLQRLAACQCGGAGWIVASTGLSDGFAREAGCTLQDDL